MDEYMFFHTCHEWIDDLTHCLIERNTGREVPTYAVLVDDWNTLSGYTKDNQWFANWDTWEEGTEVYALYVEGDSRIQGFVALMPIPSWNTVKVECIVSAPHNNTEIAGENKEYTGLTGHLFVIAAQRSIECGFEGRLVYFAASEDLVYHYQETLNGEFVGTLHMYHMINSPQTGSMLTQIYTVEIR